MSSLVQSSTAVEFLGDASSKNLSLTVSGANSVLVAVGLAVFSSTEPVIAVNDGNAYSNAVEVWFSGAPSERKKVAWFYLHNLSAGAKTIGVSFTGPSAASVFGAMRAYEVSGLANTSPIATMSNTGTSAAPATNASGTLSGANNFVVGAMVSQFGGIDLPSGFTNMYLDNSTSGAPPNSHDYQVVSSTSSITISWGTVDVSGDWAAVGAVFPDAATGQPTRSRYSGIPGARLGGQRFGRGW